MKKRLLTMMLAVVTLSAAAELREDAFIIRTTDGASQGLLFGDVEKITFSNLDDEGIPHTGVFYQELHYPDTIIRVPVTEIKEVSFKKPKAIFQPNVVHYHEAGLNEYLYKKEDMTFFFRLSIPENLVPKVDNILVSLDPTAQFGIFAYRVKEVRHTSSWVEVECVKASRIQDIYAELSGVEAVTEETPGVYESLRKAGALRTDKKRRVAGDGRSTIPFDINIDYNLYGGDDDDGDDDDDGGNKSFHIAGGVKGEIELRLSYDFSSERDFLSVNTAYEYTPYFSFSMQTEKKWEKKAFNPLSLPFLTITPPACPIFSVTVGAAPFFRALGTAKISIERTLPTARARTLAIYNNGEYMSRSATINTDSDDSDNFGIFKGSSINFSLEGSLMAGAAVDLYVGTTRVLDTSIGIVAEALIGPKLSGTIAGSIANMPTFKDGPNTMVHNLIKDWNISASWCSVELGVKYYQQILGGKEKEVELLNMSFDTDPWSISLVPDFNDVEVEMYRSSKIKDEQEEGDPLSSQYNTMRFTVTKPDGDWLLGIAPGYAIYEDDKFLKAEVTAWRYNSDSNWEDLTWITTDWYPNRTYTIYPVYHCFFDSNYIRVDSPVTLKYPGTVTTGPDSYKWLSESIVECSFSSHSDLEPFVLNPHFKARGVIVSDRPLIVENGLLQYEYDDLVHNTFEFIYEHREEGVDYANAYTTKTTGLEKGKVYYYCAAVKLGSRGGKDVFCCGDVNRIYVPMYPDTPTE